MKSFLWYQSGILANAGHIPFDNGRGTSLIAKSLHLALGVCWTKENNLTLPHSLEHETILSEACWCTEDISVCKSLRSPVLAGLKSTPLYPCPKFDRRLMANQTLASTWSQGSRFCWWVHMCAYLRWNHNQWWENSHPYCLLIQPFWTDSKERSVSESSTNLKSSRFPAAYIPLPLAYT